ncbi:SRPBCC family protein [Nocardioides sp. TRM66260-LWL]|uniref:SRPBCC family protein n=1 Tax=Nocardioides sp. TRM66260-LWL TaxID=2874478 RepID=UPI001CC66EE1|nr:SRPBCC family protein [Nocardioides sp. TRM66260-LWL]MBZ5733195.1 SRPBCC family protein [Nocardioides sp. TRM66260-LWL]
MSEQPSTIERLEAERVIVASPASIFEVLADPQGHVAIDASGMLQSATGERVSAVGDRFAVHMDREALGDLPEMGEYDVTVTITAYEAEREIAWTVLGRIRPQIGHTYGYRLEPLEPGEDGGPRTRVTSVYDWSSAAPEWKPLFPVLTETHLRATLGILAREVARRASVG